MSRSLSVASDRNARSQSMSGPPTQEFVKVAVLPPRLKEDMAPPTGLGPADIFSWDESINWSHNEKLNKPEPSNSKKFMRGIGLTTQRKKLHAETPPFMFREVPYDTWKKHYAKNAAGRYKGTHAPAEDCLLLPEDVELWRLGPPETKADLWTRGKAALPVYDEVDDTGLPTYSKTAPEIQDGPTERPVQRQESVSTYTADGKTTEQIIAEAKAKKEAGNYNLTWKQRVKKGTEFALLGTN